MKRLGRNVGVGFAVLFVVAGAALWGVAFRTPSLDVQPLPAGLIAAQSPAGAQLLAASYFVADYSRLTNNFESQSRRAFCGVASSVIVLNALRGRRLTQATFFDTAASQVRSGLHVTLAGMSLAQLADLLRAHGADVTLYYAADTRIDVFRSIVLENLQRPTDFVLVNYERAVLGQGETGHISPLAAYNAQADRLLVLDVAAYKYPPVWVATQALWAAMSTVDRASGKTRGFVVVRDSALPHT